jgi:AcrR family transcriptional regulator
MADESDAADWLTGGESRRALARERILRAAEVLFGERGVEHVSGEDIARLAGCSRATMYRYVGGKPAIVDGVVARGAMSVVEQVRRALAGCQESERERVIVAILASVDAVRADTVIMEVLGKSSTQQNRSYLKSNYVGATGQAVGLGLDDLQTQLYLRIALSLLTWPAADKDAERDLVERFVRAMFDED